MCFYFVGDVTACAALDLGAQMARIDMVEPGLPNLKHKHVWNSQSLISLVISNG